MRLIRKKLSILATCMVPALLLSFADAGAQRREVFLFNDHYFGVNWTGWSIDAIANCRRDAARMSGGAYRVTCTPTVYGAMMSVYQAL